MDAALQKCPSVSTCVVFKRTGDPSVQYCSRDVFWNEIDNYPTECIPEAMDSEDPLFMLFTSGSTGKPKGLVHTQAGYLLVAALSCKYIFDMRLDDIHGCMADVGWITGHT